MPLFTLLLTLTLLLLTTPVIAGNHSELFEVEVVGKGQPMLLIPGFVSDQRIWDDIVEPLVGKYQIHRIRIAGFGTTPAVESPSLASVKQGILDYIDTQGLQNPAVVGHSLGGFMGLWLATSAPGKIGPVVSVDGLPFIGPLFSRDPNVSADSLMPQAVYLRSLYQGLDAKGMAGMAANGINRQATNELHQQHVIDMARQSDPDTAADAIFTLMTTDLRAKLGRIQSDIIILGASGGFADEQSKQYMAALYQKQLMTAKRGHVAMNKNSRHFIMYDQPEWLVLQLDEFLRGAL